ncbi:hypothetical protein [Parasphingorhabdus sp.]
MESFGYAAIFVQTVKLRLGISTVLLRRILNGYDRIVLTRGHGLEGLNRPQRIGLISPFRPNQQQQKYL